MLKIDWDEVYRSSMYAFRQPGGSWFRFTLNGEPGALPMGLSDRLALSGSLLLITAWNPMSEERPLSENEDANARLRNFFDATSTPYDESYGCSLPGVEPGWREDGFVVFGTSRSHALELGREWKQRSLVWGEGEELGLLSCDEDRFVPCGVQAYPPPG
ncbi:MAG: DUF3293 domain-containing protein [Planctomycetota bacterium]|jgi:hypothetical protein